jgi:hypothetical protein
LEHQEQQFPKEDSKALTKRLKLYINHRENRDATKPFLDAVDKDRYKDYLKHIPFEIYFNKVI